jgi:hypothetical protein
MCRAIYEDSLTPGSLYNKSDRVIAQKGVHMLIAAQGRANQAKKVQQKVGCLEGKIREFDSFFVSFEGPEGRAAKKEATTASKQTRCDEFASRVALCSNLREATRLVNTTRALSEEVASDKGWNSSEAKEARTELKRTFGIATAVKARRAS